MRVALGLRLRLRTSPAALVFLGAIAASPARFAEAQMVELRLRDSAGKPIAGAIARLLRADSVVAQVLTNEQGNAVLRSAAPGTFQLRIDRIGFAGFLTQPFDLQSGTTFRADVPITTVPVSLPELVVSARSPCETKPEEGALAGVLWEEVRKALAANLLTQEQRSVTLLVREFDREVNLAGRALREWVFRTSLTRGQPFASLPARQLARSGFVYQAGDSTVFAAPDAALLLSDEFVSTHCFRAVAGERGRLGLGFEPTPNRRMRVPDVAGTLWVERLTGELKTLEFEYTGLPDQLAGGDLGGRVEFLRLPNGAWIVSYWHIRLPIVESRERRIRSRPAPQQISRTVSLLERGGRTTIAPAGARTAARAVLAGRIMDSSNGSGLGGVRISLEGGTDSVVTDEEGNFLLAVPASGPRTVSVSHPRFAMLRDRTRQEVVLSLGDTTWLHLAAPPLGEVVRVRCGSTGRRAGLVGAAWRADGTPHPAAQVTASWRMPAGTTKTERTRADEAGGFAFCNIPPDQPITLELRDAVSLLAEERIQLAWSEFRWIDLRAAPREGPPERPVAVRRVPSLSSYDRGGLASLRAASPR